jgi:tetratricopeptide (TPR) repeat protein
VLRTLAAVRAGELDQARTVLGELPGRGLGELVAPLLGSWIALAEGNSPDNVADLSGLDGIQGIDLLQQVHAALIHDLSGRREAARKAFDAATADTDVLSLRLVWLAANFYARDGETERALGLMDTYLKRNPGSTTAKLIRRRLGAAESPARLVDNAEQGLAEALFNIAGLLNQQGATDLALLYAQLSLYMHEDFAFGRMLLGEILTNQGRSDAAIAAYETVPSDSPFAYVAKLRVASALQELGKPDAAIGMLRTVADAHPDRYEPMYRIGNVHRSEEAFADAATAYRGALDRLGATNQQHWSLHYFLGIALERTDQWADAEAQFKRALELRPEQPYVMNYLAYSWVEQETNLEQAQTMLKQAVEQRPEDGFIVDSMGWVHYRLGHYDKAVRYLERAVELRPADPVINDHLGDAYWKVGRKREARFQWHRALSLDPDADVESRIETKLEQGLDAVDKAADG